MCISRGCLNLRVAEKFADHGKALAVADRNRCESMTKVVDAGVFKPRSCSYAPPERLEIGKMLARLSSSGDVRVAQKALDMA